MKQLPIGIQSFEKLRKNDLLYVDKTKQIYELAKLSTPYFLSRPRRFGKSLLCSTFKALFQGKKELFKNLWIEKSDWQWEQFPIVSINFGTIDRSSPEELKTNLIWELRTIAQENNIDISQAPSMGSKLSMLIKELAKKNGPVVVIVDEYDKPILDHITDPKSAREIRKILKSFYETLKGLDEYLRFVFITGITKFSKTSIFSGMNNLEDLSFTAQAATLCGYTHQELITNFDQHLDEVALEQQTTTDNVIAMMKTWYNGYRFYEKVSADEYVYNPFSVLLSLKNKTFENYWFETGTPTFLINVIKEKNYPVMQMEKAKLGKSDLGSFDIDDINLLTLLFQTGYLTISDYIPSQRNYVLACPNHEVRFSLSKHIVRSMTNLPIDQFNQFIDQFRTALENSDLEIFCQTLQNFLILVPCSIRIKKEKYYHSLFFIIVRLFLADVFVEQATQIGYVDAVIQTETHIFVIEFKYGGTIEKALKQIEDKKYSEQYVLQYPNKKIMHAGIVFDIEDKDFTMKWVIESR